MFDSSLQSQKVANDDISVITKKLSVPVQPAQQHQNMTNNHSIFFGHSSQFNQEQKGYDFTVYAKVPEHENYAIDNVTVILHETFLPNTIQLRKAPFQLSRTAYANFKVIFKVQFKSLASAANSSLLSFDYPLLLKTASDEKEIKFILKDELALAKQIKLNLVNNNSDNENPLHYQQFDYGWIKTSLGQLWNGIFNEDYETCKLVLENKQEHVNKREIIRGQFKTQPLSNDMTPIRLQYVTPLALACFVVLGDLTL